VVDNQLVETQKEEHPFDFNIVESKDFTITNTEDALAGIPTEIDPVQSPLVSSSEQVVSDMAEVKSYEEIKLKADLEEEDRRNRAIKASIFNIPSTTSDMLRVVRTIAREPLPNKSIGEAVSSVIGKELNKPIRKDLSSGINVAIGQQISKQEAEKSLVLPPGNFQANMRTPNSAVESIAIHFGDKSGSESVSTPLEFLEFINPVGGESPKGMDIPLWEMTKDIFTLDFDADDFAERMESNYGKDWGWRFTGFLGKEVAIDTLILGVTFFIPPLAGITALSLAARRAGFLGSVIRTTAIGGGGGLIQSGQNLALDRDANLQGEIIGRALGQGGIEVLGHGVRAGIRAFRGRNMKESISINAKEDGTKPLTNKELKAALSPESEISAHSSLTRAQLDGVVANYNKATSDVADALMDNTLPPEIRKSLAAHLGIDAGRLDNIKLDIVLPLFKNQNETLLKQGLTIPLLERQGSEFSNLKYLQGIYFEDLTVPLRATSRNINKSAIPTLYKGMKTVGLAEPEKLALQSGPNFHTSKSFTAKQINGFNQMWRDVYSGLSSKEKKLLGAINKEGDANEVIYDFVEIAPKLTGRKVSPKVQEAYRKFRFVNDLTYEVADAGAVATLKDSVFKTRGGYVQVQKSAKDLKNFKANENVSVRKFDENVQLAVGEKFTIKARVLQNPKNEITTIVPYRTGHVPRSYRDQQFAVVVLNKNTGKVDYEATFDSNPAATKWMDDRNKLLNLNEEIAIKIWNKMDSGAGGVHMTRQSAKLMSQVDERTAELFRKGLLDNGIGENQVRVLLNKMIAAPVVPGFTKARGIGVATSKKAQEARLKLARNPKDEQAQKEFAEAVYEDTPVTKTTQINYSSSIAHNSGYDNWRKYSFDDWSSRYGHLIEEGKIPDPLLPVFKDAPQFGAKQFRKEVSEATDYSNWLKQTIKHRDWLEDRYDDILVTTSDAIARKAVEGSVSAKAVSKVIDNLVPEAKGLENTLRFVAAFPKLLTGNTAQIVVQGSQAALGAGAAFGFNPRLMVGSMYKLGKITGLEAARRLGRRVPKDPKLNSARQVHKEMIESGYFADLQTTDTAFGMSHGLDPSAMRKTWEFTKRVGAVPFRLGEALNRSVAYVTVRDQVAFAISQAEKKGFANLKPELQRLASDFDGNLMTTASIGSHAFREAVVEKAKVIALSMGKAGELRLMSGSGSVALQFKQVLAKEISVIDSSLLSLREKIVGAGTMIGLFGAGAIPLAGDILKLSDYIFSSKDEPLDRLYFKDQADAFNKMLGDNLESFSDGFVSTEGVQRFFKKGLITAASEGEIDFANRVALGNFINETWDVQDPLEVIVSFAVLQDVVDAAKKLGVTTMLNPLSMMEVSARVLAGEDFRDVLLDKFEPDSTASKLISGEVELGGAILDVFRESGKVFSQVGSISRVLDVANRDIVAPEAYWRNPFATQTYATSGLRGIPVERTRSRDIQFLLGITPGKIVEHYSKSRTERIYAEAIKDFGYDLEGKFRSLFGAPEAQKRVSAKAIQQLVLLRKHLRDSGLDTPITSGALKSVHNKLTKLILDIQTGGR